MKNVKHFGDLEIAVLQKLLSRKVIHSHHMRLPNFLRCGWKPNEKHFVKKAVENLIRKDFICWIKRDKKALSINKNKVADVIKMCAKGG